MTQTNHLINPTGGQQREIQPTLGTSHSGLCKSQKGERETKPIMENNIGGTRNTALEIPMGLPQARSSQEAYQYLINQWRYWYASE